MNRAPIWVSLLHPKEIYNRPSYWGWFGKFSGSEKDPPTQGKPCSLIISLPLNNTDCDCFLEKEKRPCSNHVSNIKFNLYIILVSWQKDLKTNTMRGGDFFIFRKLLRRLGVFFILRVGVFFVLRGWPYGDTCQNRLWWEQSIWNIDLHICSFMLSI